MTGRIYDGAKLFTSVEVRKLQNNPVYSTCIYLHDYTHVLCNLFAKWKTINVGFVLFTSTRFSQFLDINHINYILQHVLTENHAELFYLEQCKSILESQTFYFAVN